MPLFCNLLYRFSSPSALTADVHSSSTAYLPSKDTCQHKEYQMGSGSRSRMHCPVSVRHGIAELSGRSLCVSACNIQANRTRCNELELFHI